MSSNPNENDIRTVTAASLIIKAFRDAHPHSKIEEFIDKDTVMAVLNHVECDGLNYYAARFTCTVQIATH